MSLEFSYQREKWVADQLERQGMNPIGRRTAVELRRYYSEQHEQRGGSIGIPPEVPLYVLTDQHAWLGQPFFSQELPNGANVD